MTDGMGGALAPVDRVSAPEQVADRIRDAIFEGVFRPGDHLTESLLTERLAVSRAPVREGLQRLIQEGLLTNEPHRGIFVQVLNIEDVEDVYFVREAIEREAVRHLVESGRHAEVASKLEVIATAIEDATADGQWEKVSRADLRFHQRLVDSCESTRLTRVFATIIVETQMCLRMLARADVRRGDLVEEHHELQRLIASGDRDTTTAALRDHFSQAVRTLKEEIDKRDESISAEPVGKERS